MVSVYLMNKNLKIIPWDIIPEDTTRLYLKGNQITYLNWKDFKNLKYINLDSNKITCLNWKDAPKNLKRINLNDNQIIYLNWKGAPESLEEIALCNNQLRKINWSGVPESLRSISLTGNKIKELKMKEAPRNLNYIFAINNRISTLDPWENWPDNLKTLCLRENPIEDKFIPESIKEEYKRINKYHYLPPPSVDFYKLYYDFKNPRIPEETTSILPKEITLYQVIFIIFMVLFCLFPKIEN